jgi:hypothetical protein
MSYWLCSRRHLTGRWQQLSVETTVVHIDIHHPTDNTLLRYVEVVSADSWSSEYDGSVHAMLECIHAMECHPCRRQHSRHSLATFFTTVSIARSLRCGWATSRSRPHRFTYRPTCSLKSALWQRPRLRPPAPSAADPAIAYLSSLIFRQMLHPRSRGGSRGFPRLDEIPDRLMHCVRDSNLDRFPCPTKTSCYCPIARPRALRLWLYCALPA